MSLAEYGGIRLQKKLQFNCFPLYTFKTWILFWDMLGRKAGTRGIQKAKEREKSKVRNIFIVLMEIVVETQCSCLFLFLNWVYISSNL